MKAGPLCLDYRLCPEKAAEAIKFLREVAAYSFEVSVASLQVRCRRRSPARLAWPRFVGCYLCSSLTQASRKEIAAAFGYRWPTDVRFAVIRVEERCSIEPEFKEKIDFFLTQCNTTIERLKLEVAA